MLLSDDGLLCLISPHFTATATEVQGACLAWGLRWLCPSCKGYSSKASLASSVESLCASIFLHRAPLPGIRTGKDLMTCTKLGDLSVTRACHYRTPVPSAAPGLVLWSDQIT